LCLFNFWGTQDTVKYPQAANKQQGQGEWPWSFIDIHDVMLFFVGGGGWDLLGSESKFL
jgi:hypothetical protein